MAVVKQCPVPDCCRVHAPGDSYCASHGVRLTVVSPPLVDPGTLIAGKYRIVGKIGAGGMGELYRAMQLSPHQEVAVKVLLPQHMKEHSKRFLAEAERAAQVRHPHCVTVYEVGENADGLLYIVMEYIPGSDLSDLIKLEGPTSPGHDPTGWTSRCLSIARQICDVLDCAHSLTPPLVHRDIKPSNIRIWDAPGAHDFAKLLDFGIAKQIGNTGFTRTGQFPGTPAYISPEQIEAKAIDGRSDLYSLGVVLFEMLSGEQPFIGTSDYDTAWMRLRVPPPGLHSKNKSIEPVAESLVARLLQRYPGNRPASAAHLREAIDRALAELAVGKTKGRAKQPSSVKQEPQPQQEPETEYAIAVGGSKSRPSRKITGQRVIWFLGGVTVAAIAGFLGFRGDQGRPELPVGTPASAETVFVSANVRADSIATMYRTQYEKRYRQDSSALYAAHRTDSIRLAAAVDDRIRNAVSTEKLSWQQEHASDGARRSSPVSDQRDTTRPQMPAASSEMPSHESSLVLRPGDSLAIGFRLAPGLVANAPCSNMARLGAPARSLAAFVFTSGSSVARVTLLPQDSAANSLEIWTYRRVNKFEQAVSIGHLQRRGRNVFQAYYDRFSSRISVRFDSIGDPLPLNVFWQGESVTFQFCSLDPSIVFDTAAIR